MVDELPVPLLVPPLLGEAAPDEHPETENMADHPSSNAIQSEQPPTPPAARRRAAANKPKPNVAPSETESQASLNGLTARMSNAVVVCCVATVSVTTTGVPLRATVPGEKLQDAFCGRFEHDIATVPEKSVLGVIDTE